MYDDYDERPPIQPSPIMVAIMTAIGIVIVVTIMSLSPGMMVIFENSVSSAIAPGPASSWNKTVRAAAGNATIMEGSMFYNSNIFLPAILVVITVVGIALSYLIRTPRPPGGRY